MQDQIVQEICQEKVIAIVRGVEPATCLKVVRALYAGGIRFVEVTFSQKDPTSFSTTAGLISSIAEEMAGKMHVGAGTVITQQQLRLAADAGAKFIISPNTDPQIISTTKEMGLISLPGALTPSEIVTAYAAGADFVKLFPIAQMGVAYVKAIRAPISHIPLMAVGGVNETNLKSYLDAGCVGAGIGGNLVNAAWIKAGEFERITEVAKQLVEIVRESRAS